MRHVVDRSAHHRLVRMAALVLTVLAVSLLAAGVAAAASSDLSADQAAQAASPQPMAEASGDPSPDPSPSPSPEPASITCELSQASVVYGARVTVSGVVTPAGKGQEVAITLGGAAVATVTTNASGAYTYTFAPARGGSVRARLVAYGTASESQALVVKPAVQITRSGLVPFLRTRFVVKVTPPAYNGVVVARVTHGGIAMGAYKRSVRGGRAVFDIPLRGVGRFTLSFTLSASDGFASRRPLMTVVTRGERLAVGSGGQQVKGMLTALRRLQICVPSIGTTFTTSTKDAVMAFQKAYGLPRTYVFSDRDWRKLDKAKTLKPKYKSPSTHIEVDKGRQILMVVKNGSIAGLICVSTGATGNTPEGAFHVQQKHPYTSSGFGGTLYRTIGFLGDFAIHGWVPVPPYPASHGCVREPMWVANWVYNQSFVGERVYVYH